MTNLIFIGYFTLSFYCPCRHCSPNGVTAMQTVPTSGLTIAAPRNIPLGTRIYLQGFGWKLGEDRMHVKAERKGRLDVFYYDGKSTWRSHRECLKRGLVHKVPVYREPTK